MKYRNMLGLAALATALMALGTAGSASATELTCGPSMCAQVTTIHAESEGKVIIHSPIGDIECNKTMEGHTLNTGSATETVQFAITTLTFTNCNPGDTVTVLAAGSLVIHTEYTTEVDGSQVQKTNSTNNGTVTSTGMRITVIHLGVHCIFETNVTDIGVLTGSANTGGHATLDTSGNLPRVGGEGGAFCGSSSPWTGSDTVRLPSVLNVD